MSRTEMDKDVIEAPECPSSGFGTDRDVNER